MLSVANYDFLGHFERLLISGTHMVFKTADNDDEYKQADRLVYEAYTRKGYVKNHSDYENYKEVHNSFQEKRVFVAKKNQSVIMTLTLITDSRKGLPMDEIYHNELRFLRHSGRKLAELSAFAVSPDFEKRNLHMALNLMRCVYLYAKRCGIDDFCITVNPRHESFYKNFLFFENLGAEKAYPLVSDNPACAKRLNLRTVEEKVRTRRNPIYKILLKDLYAGDSFHAALRIPIPA